MNVRNIVLRPGDRVRIVDYSFPKDVGKELTVANVHDDGSFTPVRQPGWTLFATSVEVVQRAELNQVIEHLKSYGLQYGEPPAIHTRPKKEGE